MVLDVFVLIRGKREGCYTLTKSNISLWDMQFERLQRLVILYVVVLYAQLVLLRAQSLVVCKEATISIPSPLNTLRN